MHRFSVIPAGDVCGTLFALKTSKAAPRASSVPFVSWRYVFAFPLTVNSNMQHMTDISRVVLSDVRVV